MAQHVAVDDENVLPAVHVEVGEDGAEADVALADGGDAGLLAAEGKHVVLASVAVEGVHLILVVGHEDAGQAAAIVVGDVDAHASLRYAFFVAGNALDQAKLLKLPIAAVEVEEIIDRIIRNINARAA